MRKLTGKNRIPLWKNPKASGRLLKALVASETGEIIELEDYGAVGMCAARRQQLTLSDTLPMPFGGELMMLPGRKPVVFSLERKRFETLYEDPFRPGRPIYPVAAFNSPGYVVKSISAYVEDIDARPLPLFSYGAVGCHRGNFRTAVFRVDREKRQDLRRMPASGVMAGIERMRRKIPENRLRAHLENCALEYGCPAGKNFFLGRFEAPLPASPRCNAECLGCISRQSGNDVCHSQNRIAFKPSAQEIAQVALAHIHKVKRSVVSFGQGCEGDPLLAADVIEPAIRMIRKATREGTIHLNTNASLPGVLKKLMAAGLDSVRVSLNSVRDECYRAYFRPKGFRFADVLRSIDAALNQGKFVSVNYLNCPGFSDSPEEYEALLQFIENHPVNMIQWRNLNLDPLRYWREMEQAAPMGDPLGMQSVVAGVRKAFPHILHGYFNPPKEKFKRE